MSGWEFTDGGLNAEELEAARRYAAGHLRRLVLRRWPGGGACGRGLRWLRRTCGGG